MTTTPQTQVDPVPAAERVRAGDVVLLDVCEDDEWAAGHAPHAVHHPLGGLDPRRPSPGTTGHRGLPIRRPVIAGRHRPRGSRDGRHQPHWRYAGLAGRRAARRHRRREPRNGDLMLAIAIVAGIVIGLSLGALGGGGSILTVPVLVYALG